MKLEDYFKLSVELLPYNLWKFSFGKHFHFLNNQRTAWNSDYQNGRKQNN